jgi:hypothetical protein
MQRTVWQIQYWYEKETSTVVSSMAVRNRQEKETNDAASSTMDKSSARERNERYNERYDGSDITRREMSDTASDTVGKTSARQRNK